MKHKVLVFPCGSEIGLEIYRSLCYSIHFDVYGASSVDDHGKFVYSNYIGGLPYASAPEFIEALSSIIREHNIDFIIPAHDEVVVALAEAEESNKLTCKVIGSPLETCKVARSKSKTYELLNGIIPVPKVYANASEVDSSNYPIFLKPDVGQGSKGTYVAAFPDEAVFYTKKDPALLLLEYLPGKEFTIDCFTDKDGVLLYCEGRERARTSGGISVNSKAVDDERFMDLANKINEALIFNGAWFFQVKEDHNNELVLMEIAPRIAGTMGYARARGANLVLLSLFNALGYPVNIYTNTAKLIIDRALEARFEHNLIYRHVYLDFDDTVILNGKINPFVMSFVFQCLNKKIKVHLLTRHKSDITTTLTQYRLNDIFDSIIWIDEENQKYKYIKEEDAIFIDDSFAERKRVHDNCGIAVFDAHMVESLMEKF